MSPRPLLAATPLRNLMVLAALAMLLVTISIPSRPPVRTASADAPVPADAPRG